MVTHEKFSELLMSASMALGGVLLAVALLLPGHVQAHNPRVPGEACRRVAHGTLCTVNGRWHSISCQSGYKPSPAGRGTSCVAR